MAIEYLCFSKVPSARILASIVVLLTGIALATVTDSQVASRPLGMLVAAVNVVITGALGCLFVYRLLGDWRCVVHCDVCEMLAQRA